ncbi:MAG: hypothetical protein R3E18_05890 [Sphingomonadaceae bacterium]
MELNTYRYRGTPCLARQIPHARRSAGCARAQGPIEGLKVLLEKGKTEDDLKAIDKAIRARVTEAADFAENSPEPPAGDLYTDVVVGNY